MSDNCLFCKIAKGEISSQKIFENEHVFGFVDIHPQAKNHLLFIHKNHSSNINQMAEDGQSLSQVFSAIAKFTQSNDLQNSGFRIVTNLGSNAGQTVFHTHFHIVGGEKLGTFGR